MAVRLYLDEDIDLLIARHLRARGYDVVSALEVGMIAVDDAEHLAHAAREGRALLTFNVRHFRALYDWWWDEGRPHAGIIVSRQYRRREIGELLRLVEHVLQLATDKDLTNRLRYLSEFDV